MAELPTLPLEVQAEIELAHERLRNVAKVKWPMVFGITFPDTSLVPVPPKHRRPANLKLQLQGYASARFDVEAQHYPRHAKDELELRASLSLLAANVSLEMFRDLDRYRSFYDFHCPVTERQAAISEALSKRADHWIEIAKHQFKFSLFSGKLEPLLASGKHRAELEPSINPSDKPTQEIAFRTSTREERPRGHRKEIQAWMRRKQIETIAEAAKRLGLSKSALKSIMSSKGKARYGPATLKRILEDIRK
jgi:hypothetical protein